MVLCSWERLILFLEKDQINQIKEIEYSNSPAGRKTNIRKN